MFALQVISRIIPRVIPRIFHHVWIILALPLLIMAGCSTVLSTTPTTLRPTTLRVVAPTFTPTPAQVAQAVPENVAEIDAAGLDVAERRVIDVYQRVSPAVVSINTRVMVRDFFYNAVPQEGSGSGFVIDTSGHLLTNYHVVEGAEEITVVFGEGDSYVATVVGADPRNDIALLRVDAPAELLVPVELGTSAGLLVGQRAIAIGNPFGQFGRTLTTGVISALGRTLEGDDGRPITGVIQTDASINRGNSGGPLLDSSGRVIGINSAIFSPSGASAGVGFAVPVDTVRRAQQEVIVRNQRVYVGGDILQRINDTPITNLEQLETLLEDNFGVGDVVTVALLREGQEYSITVSLAEEPS